MPAKTQAMRAQQHAPRTSSNLNLELPTFSFDKESLVAGTNLPAPPREPSPAPPPTLQRQKRESQMDPLRSHPTTPDNSSPAPGDRVKAQENGAGPTSSPDTPMTNNNKAGQGSSAPAMASSGMKRPHHVRRLLSIRSLSQTFANHGRSESSTSTASTAVGGGGGGVGGSDFGPPTGGRSRTPSIFGRSSTSTWGMRPESRGGWSTVGSTTDGVADGGGRQKLRKRMSGAFWSRRNSMTMTRLMDEKIDESPNEAAAQRKKTPPPQLPEIGKLKVGNQLKGEDGGFLNGEDMFKGIEYKPEI